MQATAGAMGLKTASALEINLQIQNKNKQQQQHQQNQQTNQDLICLRRKSRRKYMDRLTWSCWVNGVRNDIFQISCDMIL